MRARILTEKLDVYFSTKYLSAEITFYITALCAHVLQNSRTQQEAGNVNN